QARFVGEELEDLHDILFELLRKFGHRDSPFGADRFHHICNHFFLPLIFTETWLRGMVLSRTSRIWPRSPALPHTGSIIRDFLPGGKSDFLIEFPVAP